MLKKHFLRICLSFLVGAILLSLLLVFPIFFVSSSPSWVIEGNSVIMEDSKVFFNITPHTGNLPVAQFKSKVYSGDADVIVCFNTNDVTPQKAETNPHLRNVTRVYTCPTQYFNYSVADKMAYCYDNITFLNEFNETESYWRLLYSHNYDSGDVGTRTIYWNETELIWEDISGIFTPREVNFSGYNKCYVKSGLNINAGQFYYLRLHFSQKYINQPSYKYFLGIKPSGETLQESINDGHFYYIDPWTEDLNTNIYAYHPWNETSGTVAQEVVNSVYNITTTNGHQNVSGKIGYGYSPASENRDTGIDVNTFSSGFTWAGWIYRSSTWPGANIFRPNLANGNNGLAFISAEASNYLYFSVFDDTSEKSVSSATIAADRWYHVAITVDSSNLSAYIDGSLIGSRVISNFDFPSTNLYYFSNPPYVNSYFSGSVIDETGIWAAVLTPSQIANLNTSITYSFVDSENPSVSGLTESPSDPATFSEGTISEFNATVTDNNEVTSVLLQFGTPFGHTNYTANNLTANVYNVSFLNVSQGYYDYQWIATDNFGNVNNSETGTYTLNSAGGAGSCDLGCISLTSGCTAVLDGSCTLIGT